MAVSRYGGVIIEWTKEEVRSLGRVTRRTMTMNGALLPKADVERLFVRTKLKVGGYKLVARVHTKFDNNLGWYLDNATAKFLIDTKVVGVIETEENVSKNKFKRRGLIKA